MDYNLKSGSPGALRAGCIIVAALDGTTLSPEAEILDKVSDGALSRALKRGDLGKQSGSARLLLDVPNLNSPRVLLVRATKALDENQFSTLVGNCYSALAGTGSKDAVFYLHSITVQSRELDWKVRHAIQILEDRTYRFSAFKSDTKENTKMLARVSFAALEKPDLAGLQAAIKQGKAIAAGRSVAKTLGDLPGNVCTPTYLGKQAQQLAKEYTSLTTKVLTEKQMQDLGMGSLLSVSAGSAEPAKLIVMQYQGAAKTAKPQVLVGKGITFDTGGISLKPGAAMDEMKYDMCGAASVFGTIKAVCELGLKINVVGIVAAAENMPGSKATKPGDIVTSMSGTTVEVLNTDAEGRLVLCDALTYAERFKPAAVIDIATLTGACVIALGRHASGLFSNDDSLAKDILEAGHTAHDRAWQLPIWDEYKKQLDSNFADLANIGGREAGSITAACFLGHFAKKQRWAHIDIAGTAWTSGKAKGASGRPVALLTQYLLDRTAT